MLFYVCRVKFNRLYFLVVIKYKIFAPLINTAKAFTCQRRNIYL